MRLFIAINFDELTKQNIIAVQHRLQKLGSGNFSRPDNLHLTLAFLGEIEDSRINAVCEAMDRTKIMPLKLKFDHVGCFKRDGGDLWWIGMEQNDSLLSMQKELCRNLNNCGFELESRRFSPHITLGRELRLGEEPDRHKILGEPFSTRADAISLMLSTRIKGELTYIEKHRVNAK